MINTKERNLNTPIIADPWDLSNSGEQEKPILAWSLPTQQLCLTGVDTSKAILPDVSPSFLIIHIILQDWLKLGSKKAKQFNQDLTAILGLLYLN